MKEEILRLFVKKKYSPYSIHVKLGCSIKEVYHYLEQYEEKIRRDLASEREERHTQ